MYEIFKTAAAIFCFVIGILIIFIIVKTEEKNEKNS
jgi:hypothetical protein